MALMNLVSLLLLLLPCKPRIKRFISWIEALYCFTIFPQSSISLLVFLSCFLPHLESRFVLMIHPYLHIFHMNLIFQEHLLVKRAVSSVKTRAIVHRDCSQAGSMTAFAVSVAGYPTPPMCRNSTWIFFLFIHELSSLRVMYNLSAVYCPVKLGSLNDTWHAVYYIFRSAN